jgi:hypothetical protein
MPRKVFDAGEVLAASDVNDFLMDQAVMSFASTAARGSAIGIAVEGMVTYLEDANTLSVNNGTDWTIDRTIQVFADSTARGSAIGTAVEGMYSHLNDTDSLEYYDGSAWVNVGGDGGGGLELVKVETIGTAVASVVVSSAFSTTYDSYRIIISGSTGATQNIAVNLTFNNSAGSTYNFGGTGITWATGASAVISGSASSSGIRVAATGTSSNTNASFDVLQPFLTTTTTTHGSFTNQATAFTQNGLDTNIASQTGFTLTTTTTLTGGKIYVYGYRKA